MDSKSVRCLFCYKTFTCKSSLNVHRYRSHPEQSMRKQLQGELKCVAENCDWRTNSKDSFTRHIKRKHPELKKENSNEEDHEYQCSICGARFFKLDRLREHYATVEMKETGEKTFSNLSEYNNWFDNLKLEKHVNYVKVRNWRPKRGNYMVQYYKCQHSGNVERKGELPPSKAPGQRISIRLNLICSAFLKAKIYDSERIEVSYCAEHSHSVLPAKMPIPDDIDRMWQLEFNDYDPSLFQDKPQCSTASNSLREHQDIEQNCHSENQETDHQRDIVQFKHSFLELPHLVENINPDRLSTSELSTLKCNLNSMLSILKRPIELNNRMDVSKKHFEPQRLFALTKRTEARKRRRTMKPNSNESSATQHSNE